MVLPWGQGQLPISPPFFEATSSFLRARDELIEVRPGQKTKLEVNWDTGGALEVRVFDENGRPRAAACTLYSDLAPQTPLEVEFFRSELASTYRDPKIPSPAGSGDTFARVVPPLEPGLYCIEARLGASETIQREVRVEASTVIRVTLVVRRGDDERAKPPLR